MKFSTKFLAILAVGFTLGFAAYAGDLAAGTSANNEKDCDTCSKGKISRAQDDVQYVKPDFKQDKPAASGNAKSAKDCPPESCGPE
jgi:hypothetical protein